MTWQIIIGIFLASLKVSFNPNFTLPGGLIRPCYNAADGIQKSQAMTSMRPQRYVRSRARIISNNLVWGLLALFLLAVLATIILTFSYFRSLAAGKALAPAEGLVINTPGPGTPFTLNEENTNVPLQADNRPAPQAWDGSSRINVLVMGLDARDWEDDGGPSRTDTMILFTLDPATHSAGILSIPRDLWVNIPGFDYAKINTAYFLGEAYQVDGGGPQLAMTTVEEFLDVDINYYAQVDFSAFEGFITEIGGIDVTVVESIEIDPIGPGNTVILDAGIQHLDGPTALAYARARNTPGGDIDRADRQQQVILAIRSQILNLNMLPLLMQKSPILYAQLSQGVHTNLTLEQLLAVAWAASQIPAENIKRGQIGYDQATLTMSWDGQSILMPDSVAVYALRDEIFTPGSQPSPTVFIAPATAAPTSNPFDNFQAEGASVSVLNGTEVNGLAASTRDYLLGEGINVTGTGNADQVYDFTTVIDYAGKIYTSQVLANLLNAQGSQVYSSYDPNAAFDIVVILGNDWAQSNPLP